MSGIESKLEALKGLGSKVLELGKKYVPLRREAPIEDNPISAYQIGESEGQIGDAGYLSSGGGYK
ncbi:hypothetical protein GOV05_03805 [Candidatus Woesearchaeota archaeon]|nr:hypothetical protein [Candidatus Woesearchaeota archaeon]